MLMSNNVANVIAITTAYPKHRFPRRVSKVLDISTSILKSLRLQHTSHHCTEQYHRLNLYI